MALKSAIINVMEGAARKASRGLIRDMGEIPHLQVSRKGPADYVTAADLRVEQLLKEELKKARPGYGFVMEESGTSAGSDNENAFIVDPIDGTTNFIHGIAHFAVSIAHRHKGEIVAGVIYQPIGDEMFWAEKNMGAYLNNRRMRVSVRQQLADSLIATGLPFKGKSKHPRTMATVDAVVHEVAGVRRFGAASLDLAWVAAGRFDGFWEFGLSPWDMAAGIVIVREAGGTVTDTAGGERMLETGTILAAAPGIHRPLKDLIGKALKE